MLLPPAAGAGGDGSQGRGDGSWGGVMAQDTEESH